MQVQSFVIQIMYMVAFSVESVSGRSTHRYNSLPSYSTRCGGVAHVVLVVEITLTRFGG